MSSAMAGQPQQGKPGELDQPRDQTPQQPENTPDSPKQEEQQKAKKPEPQKEQKKPGEGKPESPEKNPLTGQNSPDADPENKPENKKGTAIPASMDAERWGELPSRVRATFRNQGKDDLPVQYREWIDAYYRRLSRQR